MIRTALHVKNEGGVRGICLGFVGEGGSGDLLQHAPQKSSVSSGVQDFLLPL